jgi:hypothetical protein
LPAKRSEYCAHPEEIDGAGAYDQPPGSSILAGRVDSGRDGCISQVAKVAGFSLHAGVAIQARERHKLGRLCQNISRPAVSEKRLSLSSSGIIRYQLKRPDVKQAVPCHTGGE